MENQDSVNVGKVHSSGEGLLSESQIADLAAPLLVVVQNAIAEDWDLVKDTAGRVADQKTIFDLAFRFGWHAASKHYSQAINTLVSSGEPSPQR